MNRTYVMVSEHFNFHVTLDESPDPAAFERHCHEQYELIYVTRGSGRFMVEDVEYPLKANTLFLFRPKEYHWVSVAHNIPYERYVIHFAPQALTEEVKPLLERLEHANGGGNFYDRGQVPLVADAIFALLNAVGQMPKEEGELLTRLILSEILVALSVARPGKPETSEPLGGRILRYLNDHLTERITLEELANHFFVSKYYICRAFRQQSGVSVLQYLTEKRVYLARRLIERGQTAVSAAMESGFGDYSSFYRAHTRICGEPPTGKEYPKIHPRRTRAGR